MVPTRFALYLERLSRRLWVRVAAMAVLSLLALALAAVIEPYLPDKIANALVEEDVLPVLSILASSMLAVSTFSLGTMVSAHRGAASNATPRVHQLLMQDATTINVLSIFIGAFVYSLTAILLFRLGLHGRGGPVVVMAVTIAVIALLVVAMLRWIDHLSDLGSMGATLDLTEGRARNALQRHCDAPFLGGVPIEADHVLPTDAVALEAEASGTLQAIDVEALNACAEAAGVHVWLERMPGQAVLAGWPVARIGGTVDESTADRMLKCFVIGTGRTFEQDAVFGLIVLSEIASRALSPGINDPGTAIDVISRLERLLWDHARGSHNRAVRFTRVHVPPRSEAEFVEAAFAAIARDGAGQIEVATHLNATLNALGNSGSVEMVEGAKAMRDRLYAHAESALPIRADLEQLRV